MIKKQHKKFFFVSEEKQNLELLFVVTEPKYDNLMYNRLYQILLTFSNFLSKTVVQLAIQYAPKFFCLNFHLTPPQGTFP